MSAKLCKNHYWGPAWTILAPTVCWKYTTSMGYTVTFQQLGPYLKHLNHSPSDVVLVAHMLPATLFRLTHITLSQPHTSYHFAGWHHATPDAPD